MSGNFLGIVQDGEFRLLYPQSDSGISVKLTKDSMVVGRPITELDLNEYEGKAIMVHGDRRDWIYLAQVIDQAGPILTAIVQQIFGKGGESQ